MALFDRLRGKSAHGGTPRAAASQLRVQPPDASASGYDAAACRMLRRSIPAIDAAVQKLIRLAGGVEVELSGSADCETLGEELARFLAVVPTGRRQRGLPSFLDSYLDSLLITGRACGEVVCSTDGIEALLCADVAKIIPVEGVSPLDFRLDAIDPNGRVYTPPRQDLLLFTTHQPEPASPYGTSILRSVSPCADALLKIFRAIGSNWERLGNPRFILSYRGDSDDILTTQQQAEQLAAEWEKTMAAARCGETRDFITVGDIDAKIIGADGQIMDPQIPARLLTEQIIAKTGVPPFMLGFSWSTTERMSAQQADILTSELDAIRRTVTPAIERIVELWLAIRGKSNVKINVKWATVNLQDEVELARARLINAQAETYKEEL